jgi:hypothetical protein
MNKNELSVSEIASRIIYIRGQKVMLDSDLASMYGVETRALNQAVKRNMKRFPEDFFFQLTQDEWYSLRSQNVTLEANESPRRKRRRIHQMTPPLPLPLKGREREGS